MLALLIFLLAALAGTLAALNFVNHPEPHEGDLVKVIRCGLNEPTPFLPDADKGVFGYVEEIDEWGDVCLVSGSDRTIGWVASQNVEVIERDAFEGV